MRRRRSCMVSKSQTIEKVSTVLGRVACESCHTNLIHSYNVVTWRVS